MRGIKYIGCIILIGVGIYTALFFREETEKQEIKEKEIQLYEKKKIEDTDVLGMIEIVKTNKKSLIKKGNVNTIIAQNQVASMTQNLDIKQTIFLAGHSIPSVFGDLHQSQIGDRIILLIQEKVYHYTIESIRTVRTDDFTPLEAEYKYPQLVLITCTNRSSIRLLVFAKLTDD